MASKSFINFIEANGIAYYPERKWYEPKRLYRLKSKFYYFQIHGLYKDFCSLLNLYNEVVKFNDTQFRKYQIYCIEKYNVELPNIAFDNIDAATALVENLIKYFSCSPSYSIYEDIYLYYQNEIRKTKKFFIFQAIQNTPSYGVVIIRNNCSNKINIVFEQQIQKIIQDKDSENIAISQNSLAFRPMNISDDTIEKIADQWNGSVCETSIEYV